MPKPINPETAHKQLKRRAPLTIPDHCKADVVIPKTSSIRKELEMIIYMLIASSDYSREARHQILDLVLKTKDKEALEYFFGVLICMDCSIRLIIENTKKDHQLTIEYDDIEKQYKKKFETKKT